MTLKRCTNCTKFEKPHRCKDGDTGIMNPDAYFCPEWESTPEARANNQDFCNEVNK